MCEVKPLQDSACQLEGGYMHQGWCVICQEKTFTECTRSDQDAAWCAVEGTCGMKVILGEVNEAADLLLLPPPLLCRSLRPLTSSTRSTVLLSYVSEDAKALNGEYGWTHWDHCIGEPAGYLPVRSIMVKVSEGRKGTKDFCLMSMAGQAKLLVAAACIDCDGGEGRDETWAQDS
eukprot:767821-Hanusia_phi.AAC.9